MGELEGRAGMVALGDSDQPLDLPGLTEGLDRALPSYARPLFLRMAAVMPLTDTFKLKKLDLQLEGFNPANTADKIYFRQSSSFIRLTQELYEDIVSGKIKVWFTWDLTWTFSKQWILRNKMILPLF